MTTAGKFLTNTRGGKSLHITDILSYLYLTLGTIIMFGPVLWLVMSSFKTSGELSKFPPRFLPYRQETVELEGFDEPLDVYQVTLEDGTVKNLVQTKRVGLIANMIDPANPDEIFKIPIEDRVALESVSFNLDNYREGISSFNFARYLRNSVIVTVLGTVLTLIVNSMAAFALSKYKFTGRDFMFVLMISALMVPLSVILVPVYLVMQQANLLNTLSGLIIPAAATPTGVFLLRQYMLTIPDELLDAARIDGASEWRIYQQIIMPLSRPALAVLTIFSVMWRWNDFLWPFLILSRNELFTLQVGLQAFQSDLTIQWDLILAMTVLTLLPITIVFAFLQKYITTGIATTGLK